MTLHTFSWFGDRSYSPVEEVQCKAKRTHRYDTFPPPLEAPTICDGQFSHLSQVDRVCFTSVRRDGRLILAAEKPRPLRPQRCIWSQRSNGRLQLWLFVKNTQQTWHKQENSIIAELSSLQHEQHYPLVASNLCDVQKQHNLCAELSPLKHCPHSENAPRPCRRHPQSNPKSNRILAEKDEQSSNSTHTLQVCHNKIKAQTLPGDPVWQPRIAISFSLEQALPLRIGSRSCEQKKASANGFSAEPIHCNPVGDLVRELNYMEAKDARLYVCAQKQRNVETAGSAACHQPSAEEKSSSSQSLTHPPTAEVVREESADADMAREGNPNAESESPRAGIESKVAENEKEEIAGTTAVVEVNAAKKSSSRAQKAGAREEKARQEKASARKARLMTEQFFLIRSAFLSNSIRPLGMLNL